MDPATLSALASLVPLVLGFFGGQKERNPTAVFNQLNALLGQQFQPILQSMLQLASSEGARVGQQIGGSVGAAGGGSTGVGAVARSVGAGLASSRASEARLGVQQAQLSALAQLFPSFLNPGVQTPGALQNFAGAFGSSLIGGQNPLMDLFNLFNRTPKSQAAFVGHTPPPRNTQGLGFSLPRGF